MSLSSVVHAGSAMLVSSGPELLLRQAVTRLLTQCCPVPGLWHYASTQSALASVDHGRARLGARSLRRAEAAGRVASHTSRGGAVCTTATTGHSAESNSAQGCRCFRFATSPELHFHEKYRKF